MYKILDLFSGIGGFSYAAHELGIGETAQFVEINPYCQKVLNKNFPNVPIHKDVKTFTASPNQFDIVTFGSPCFVAGTLILTRRGLIPIEDVVVGDEVLTHLRRWRKVNQLHCTPDRRVRRIVSRAFSVDTTDEHPFYAVRKTIHPETKTRDFSPPDFIKAKDLDEEYHCLLTTTVPPCQNSYYDATDEELKRLGWNIAATWNTEYKDIPLEVLELPKDKQRIFLQGYLQYNQRSAEDGGIRIRVTTRQLALGLALLFQSAYDTVPSIEARVANRYMLHEEEERIAFWRVVVRLNSPKPLQFFKNGYGYCYIKNNYASTRTATVYNIGVEEDESYLANGFVVHNCQDLSSAGKQKGIHGDRSGLFFHAARIAKESQPKGFIMENVVGIRKWQEQVLDELQAIGGYNLYWFSLSCKELGGCHQRERWFCLGWRDDAHSQSSAGILETEKDGVSSGEQSTPICEGEWGRRKQATDIGGCSLLSRTEVTDSHQGSKGAPRSGDRFSEEGEAIIHKAEQRGDSSTILYRGCDSVSSKLANSPCLNDGCSSDSSNCDQEEWELQESESDDRTGVRCRSEECDRLRGSTEDVANTRHGGGRSTAKQYQKRGWEILQGEPDNQDKIRCEATGCDRLRRPAEESTNSYCQSPWVEKCGNCGQERESTREHQSEILRQKDGEISAKRTGAGNSDGGSSDIANSNGFGNEEATHRGLGSASSDGGEIFSGRSSKPDSYSHPSGKGRDATKQSSGRATEKVGSCSEPTEEEVVSRICGDDDGIPPRLDQGRIAEKLDRLICDLMTPHEAYLHIKAGTASDDRTLKDRNKRIQALGNAVTPQQAAVCLYILDLLIKGEIQVCTELD